METNKTTETTGKALQTTTSGKVTELLKKQTLTEDDLNGLTGEETALLSTMLTNTIVNLKDVERDRFLKKVDPLMSNDTRNDTWEYNHTTISSSISYLMNKTGRMPTKSEIARETGLSRTTIRKHLAEYREQQLFKEQEEQFKFLKGEMLSMLYKMAVRGNVQAIKLYFEVTGVLGNNKTVNKNIIENQHNYIQINDTRLSQEEIKKLSPARLKQIEELLKLPEKAEG
ncbi:MAG: phBC6A51 family helix-turn-helix protein [Bacteroidia bacterium]